MQRPCDPSGRPVSVGELLRRYPYGQRITGWDGQNPPEVETAFRTGFRIGARRFVESRAFGFVHDGPGDMELAANLNEHLHELRAKLYDSDRWTDRRAALLRGCQHGLLDAVRARAAGVSITKLVAWLDALRNWAGEDPIRLDWEHAMPPDPREPDGPPLGRDGVPRKLWGQVLGMWTMFEPNPKADAQAPPLGNIERILHPDPAARKAPGARPVLVRMSEVRPEPVRWLWPGRIALGKLTLLAGDPGLGKSFVTLDLAARVSSGTAWPDLPIVPNPRGDVVLLSAEDDAGDTIRPRLDAMGADVSRIVVLEAVERTWSDGTTQKTYFDLTADLPALEAAIQEVNQCRLVIIDPLTAYLGQTDSHKNAEVRAVLAKLFELATKHLVAVLAVTHLNKANTMPAIYRAMGSLAFVAAARAVWAVVRDDQDETGRRRLMLPIKHNLSADNTGLSFTLEPADDVARVAWESDPVNVRADDALGGGRGTPGPQAEARTEVEAWLRQALADGPRPAKDMLDEARHAHGFSAETIKRARKAVGVEAYRPENPGPWWWRLPAEGQAIPCNKEPDHLDHLDPLPPTPEGTDGPDGQDVCDG